MRQSRGIWVLALFAAAVATGCGGGAGTTDPPITLRDTSKPKPDVVTPDVETGPELTAKVRLLGVVGLDDFPELFCGANMKVLVGAENIGDRKLRLYVPIGAASAFVVNAEPTLEPGSTDRFIIALDGSKLALAEDGQVVEGLANLENGKPFILGVAAFETVGEGIKLPTDPNLFDQREFIFDNEPPVLTVASPDVAKKTPTLSGIQPISGAVSDNIQVGHVEVRFNGNLVADVDHADGETRTLSFDHRLDLREELTAVAQLEVRGYDACGFSATIASTVKVIAHPFLRSYQQTDNPFKGSISDSFVTDWNGDGYPDILLATTVGIVLALNDGAERPGQFTELKQLTTRPTQQLAAGDLDADGDLDIVAVQSVPSIGTALAVHRRMEGDVLLLSETHELPLDKATQVRDLVLADFTNDPSDVSRDDIVIITSAQSESIVLFKRQRADESQFSDQCEVVVPEVVEAEAEAEAEGDAGDVADAAGDADTADADTADAGPQYECKELFSAPTKAGGIEGLMSVEAIDLSGDQGEPDGYLDLLVAAEKLNQVNVFANRFFETKLLDTAFSQSTVSFVWPVPSANTQNVRYFCTGNFIEEPEPGPDRIDIVAGTEDSGTWRVLRNVGDGKFQNTRGAGDPYELWNMSGAANENIVGMVCDDFDSDGHEDFALLSQSAQLLEVHLGNGQGRFNQVGAPDVLKDQLINPVNEGIGFSTSSQPQNLRVADFDQDGRPDILMDFRSNGFGVYLNRTDAEHGFDLQATRVLLTPLGKHGAAIGGQLENFIIADITGDGADDIVGLSGTRTFPSSAWLRDYHPLGRAYRDWFIEGKAAISPTVFVWTQGHYGPDMPSWPAAYDRMPRVIFGQLYTGPVNPAAMAVVDLASPGGEMKPDGKADLLIAGAPAGTPKSMLAMYINTSLPGGFWDTDGLDQISGSMFTPYEASMDLVSAPEDFAMVPSPAGPIPQIVVGTNASFSVDCEAPVPPILRTCEWSPTKLCNPPQDALCPFWSCWEPKQPDCPPASTIDKSFGGQAVAIHKIATSGPKTGQLDTNPAVPGDVVVLSGGSDSMTTFRWDKLDPVFPFMPPTTSSVGDNPKSFDVKDINNDGLLDFVASVASNVMLAFGRPGLNPFESPLAVDPGIEQKGGVDGVVLSDVNADGFLDVVFVEVGKAGVAIYLAAGTDPDDQYLRQFHGPIRVPVCRSPSRIIAHDFNGDGCETLAVLCGGVGAIATIANDTCAHRAAAP
ncbi:MAG: VCBS repeat-containing protein [Deltaproteobacteria bacterium]|nr:VCBS repeat-containing protein [Deltaproteobacteria bacterium]MCB9785996.1 VCBS repeat-containing protein [Deltaproteobacteria bacterium]